ncbi:MAG TPA: PfkB family carbohydrate kinase, partial [Tepidisphaeraceae bacterium]|nr:PfkB family carbohydrate kinase [Tepidisphaeraceae bacterium]
ACVMVQLEIPTEAVVRACDLGRRHGVPVIVDPAPAPQQPLPRALLQADVLSPNETEAEALLQQARDESGGDRLRDPKQIAANLLAAGPGMVLLKLGARGALAMTRDGQIEQVDCARVQVIDTTAAGDAFTAGYAVGLSEGMSLQDRLRLASAAGTLTCTKFGAQPALPLRAEVDRLIARQ